MGGCCGKPDDVDAPTTNEGTRFPVKNLDDQNRVVGEGTIEITDTELVLYSGTPEPVRWPLKFLRRYGFDQNLFSFEAGRRCPTGEGIYAFSTKNPEKIFKLVENNIRVNKDGGHKNGEGLTKPPDVLPSTKQPPSPTQKDSPDDPLLETSPAQPAAAKKTVYTVIDPNFLTSKQEWPIPKAKPNSYAVLDLDRMEKMREAEVAASQAPKKPKNQLNYVEIEFPGSSSGGQLPARAKPTPYTEVHPVPHSPGGVAFKQQGSVKNGSPPRVRTSTSSSRDQQHPGYSVIDFELTNAAAGLREQSGKSEEQ